MLVNELYQSINPNWFQPYSWSIFEDGLHFKIDKLTNAMGLVFACQ